MRVALHPPAVWRRAADAGQLRRRRTRLNHPPALGRICPLHAVIGATVNAVRFSGWRDLRTGDVSRFDEDGVIGQKWHD